MPFNFLCSKCGANLIILKNDIGKEAECYNCGTWNNVPENIINTEESLNCRIRRKTYTEKAKKNYSKESTNQNEKTVKKEEKEEPVKYKYKLFSITKPKLYITPGIIIINVILFIAMVLSGLSLTSPENSKLIAWGAKEGLRIVEYSQWWRLISSIFIHIDISHLIINMLCLLIVGIIAEPFFGKITFLVIFILGGLGGSISSLFLISQHSVSAGASGAIFGIASSFIPFLLVKQQSLPQKLTQNILIHILIVFGIFLISGFISKPIDSSTHIGGLLTGFGVGFFLKKPVLSDSKLSDNIANYLKKYIGVAGITAVMFLLLFLGQPVLKNILFPMYNLFERFEEGEYEKALEYIDKAEPVLYLFNDGSKIKSIIFGNAGWENYLKNDFYRCIELSEKAFKIDPSTGLYAKYNMALCYLRLGQIEKAQSIYTEIKNSDLKAPIEHRIGAIKDLKDLINNDIMTKEARNILKEIFDISIYTP